MPKRSWSDAWNCRRVLFSEKNQVGGSLMIRSGMVHMRQQYRDIAFGGYKRHIMPFVNFLSLGSQMREGQLGVFAEICMFIRRNTETVLYLFLLLGDHRIIQFLGPFCNLRGIGLLLYLFDDLFPCVHGHKSLLPTRSSQYVFDTVPDARSTRQNAPKENAPSYARRKRVCCAKPYPDFSPHLPPVTGPCHSGRD